MSLLAPSSRRRAAAPAKPTPHAEDDGAEAREAALSLLDLPPEIHVLISQQLIYPDALSLKHTNRFFYHVVNTGIELKIEWLLERRRLHLECPNTQRCELGSDLRFCRGSVKYVHSLSLPLSHTPTHTYIHIHIHVHIHVHIKIAFTPLSHPNPHSHPRSNYSPSCPANPHPRQQASHAAAEGTHGVRIPARARLSRLRHARLRQAPPARQPDAAVDARPSEPRDALGPAGRPAPGPLLALDGRVAALRRGGEKKTKRPLVTDRKNMAPVGKECNVAKG